jgi:transposase
MNSMLRCKPETTDKQRLVLTQRFLGVAEKSLARERMKTKRLTVDLGKIEQEHSRLRKHYHTILQQSKETEKAHAELLLALESANKQLAWFRKQFFGEKTETDLPLDVEHDSDNEDQEEPVPTEPKRKRGQQLGAKGHGRTDRSALPEEDPEVIDLASQCCPECQKPYSEFPDTEDSSMVEIETRIYKRIIKRKRYSTRCDCAGRTIITAPPPPKLYKKTTLGNSLWVHLLVQKMLHGMPTNRILKDLALKGLGLSAGTVTGGFKIIETLIEPLYEQLKLQCRSEHMWNADETSWRVFEDEQGLRSSKRWWLWVIAGQKSIVYILDRSRSGAVPADFFGASEGTLITDRYAAYKKLPDSISKAWCWVHVRRDFLKVFEGLPKLRNWARQWLLDIAELFVLNHKRFALWSQNQTEERQWHSANFALAEHIDQLQKNWQTQLRSAVHAEQKTILNSLKRHWKGLTLFLDDPRIPLDNNRAERLLRGCVVQRKNSYGNGSEWAGQLSAMLFSVFQTWLINGLDPERMLLEYFNECSKTPGVPPGTFDKFLPWKMEKEKLLEFKLPSSYKRPG